MKAMIKLGLVMLSLLLLVVVLRHTSPRTQSVTEPQPGSAEAQLILKAAHARRAAPYLLLAPPAESLHAILLAAIEVETNSDRKTEAFDRAVESVSDADRPAMLDSLALDVSPGAGELHKLLIRHWAESDTPAAAAWTSQLLESPAHRAALEQVAIVWANTDLSAAAGWVHTLPEGPSKQAATLALAYEAARTVAITALDLAGTLPSTRERDDLLVHAISQWPGTDSDAAAAWANGVFDPDLRQRLIAAVAVASAAQDGAGAALLAASALVAGAEQDRAAVSIVQRWTQNSPQAAASWVSQFPDIPSRTAAVQNLVALWTAQDAESAGNWLRGLPAGPLHDLGNAAYAQALADHN